LEAIQSGPRLISNGVAISGIRNKDVTTRRSGVCIDSNDNLLFYITANGLGGISLLELQKVLLSNRLKCRDALNLDGGGSSQIYFKGNVRGAPLGQQSEYIAGGDQIPIALALVENTT